MIRDRQRARSHRMEDGMTKTLTAVGVIVLAILVAAMATIGVVTVLLPIAFVASAGVLATMFAVASSRNAY